jgi:hypothetical protein
LKQLFFDSIKVTGRILKRTCRIETQSIGFIITSLSQWMVAFGINFYRKVLRLYIVFPFLVYAKLEKSEQNPITLKGLCSLFSILLDSVLGIEMK